MSEARKNLASIVNRVADGNEYVVLTRKGQDVAALVSMADLKILQILEDNIDILGGKRALDETGDTLSAMEFWQQLGL